MTTLSGDQSVEQAAPTLAPEQVVDLRDPCDEPRVPSWIPRSGCRYRGVRLAIKRVVDVTAASALLLGLTPVLGVLALAVRVSSPGPIFFRQVRIGRGGRPFTILKFRTMHADAEARLHESPELRERYLAGGFKLSLDEDPRITRLGSVLRRTSLDELPQLANVVRGEMSLVGPRPVLAEELGQYGEYRSAYLLAFPGLTGAWQVSGRDAVRFPGRAELDAEYLDSWSLTGDLSILARTVPAALTARGVE
jgi:lipopolysaccharide/colanic/teichoic acid biosynthesis glycosyltransferase